LQLIQPKVQNSNRTTFPLRSANCKGESVLIQVSFCHSGAGPITGSLGCDAVGTSFAVAGAVAAGFVSDITGASSVTGIGSTVDAQAALISGKSMSNMNHFMFRTTLTC
jgi:hypothetical protein